MKRLQNANSGLDEVDVGLIEALAGNARTPVAELARSLGLSAPSIAERIRRLEDAGVIQGYKAAVSPAALGYGLAAYIRIRPMAGQLQTVTTLLGELAEIVECDRITGDDCFIAKAHVRSVEDLEALIDRIIPYAVTNTSIVQSSPVERRLPPLTPAGSQRARFLRRLAG